MGDPTKKDVITTEGISETAKEALSVNKSRQTDHYGKGIWNSIQVQAQPKFESAPSEKVFANGNAWIVLGGQDRLGPRLGPGGFGAKGHNHTDKIDLVVGRQSSSPDYYTESAPSPFTDAARIYLAQRTNCDLNFGIDYVPEQAVHEGSEYRSAVVVKADAVRLVGREGIKIVTGKAKGVPGGSEGEQNSQGGNITHIGSIDLIAGNNIEDDEENNIKTLQPMIRGNNLVEAVQELTDIIEDLQSTTLNFIRKQMSINLAAAAHIHVSPVGPTTPSPDLAANILSKSPSLVLTRASLVAIKYNLLFYRLKFLNPAFPHWICSRACRLT